MRSEALRAAATVGCAVLVPWLAGCGQANGDEESAGRTEQAATVQAGFSDELLVSGLVRPTAMAFAPDGRVFITQQGGHLRVVKDGVLLETPFLILSTANEGERGLLGVAFDPEFSSNGWVYVYYTVRSPLHNRVSRFTANGDVAVAGSETVLVELEPLNGAISHMGGALHFGADGKLYVAVGDNTNAANSQSLSTRFGKLLRFNADGSIPQDNPFYATASGANRSIWSLGLRNPFTFEVQPGTGRMFINDVGEDLWEEINDAAAGANYGWPEAEGAASDPRFRDPVFAYGHGTRPDVGCSITGGAFYDPPTVQFPSTFVGKYFFADYCGSWIRYLDPSSGDAQGFATGARRPVDLAVGPDGLLYYLSRGGATNDGSLGRIRATREGFPIRINFQPASSVAPAGYLVDGGLRFAPRGELAYGWNVSHADTARERNANPDQLLDTFITMHARAKWEIELPNGEYDVLVGVGDATVAAHQTLEVEGVSYWAYKWLKRNEFASMSQRVVVEDGRLTLTNANTSVPTRLDYVVISVP